MKLLLRLPSCALNSFKGSSPTIGQRLTINAFDLRKDTPQRWLEIGVLGRIKKPLLFLSTLGKSASWDSIAVNVCNEQQGDCGDCQSMRYKVRHCIFLRQSKRELWRQNRCRMLRPKPSWRCRTAMPHEVAVSCASLKTGSTPNGALIFGRPFILDAIPDCL